ncbi:25815_t:CDS:2 [Gigaspora margarita]|uniref:25815_t:CDS:1 n=1 Tax=Gigaspora margarita TaxID=4874 RepID=A0ABN7V6A3_GIGMA|nr:25815_t:CDS:2 [Gigaspora margarita]
MPDTSSNDFGLCSEFCGRSLSGDCTNRKDIFASDNSTTFKGNYKPKSINYLDGPIVNGYTGSGLITINDFTFKNKFSLLLFNKISGTLKSQNPVAGIMGLGVGSQIWNQLVDNAYEQTIGFAFPNSNCAVGSITFGGLDSRFISVTDSLISTSHNKISLGGYSSEFFKKLNATKANDGNWIMPTPVPISFDVTTDSGVIGVKIPSCNMIQGKCVSIFDDSSGPLNSIILGAPFLQHKVATSISTLQLTIISQPIITPQPQPTDSFILTLTGSFISTGLAIPTDSFWHTGPSIPTDVSRSTDLSITIGSPIPTRLPTHTRLFQPTSSSPTDSSQTANLSRGTSQPIGSSSTNSSRPTNSSLPTDSSRHIGLLPTGSSQHTGALPKGSLPTASSRHIGALPKGSLPTNSSRHTGLLPKDALHTDSSRRTGSLPKDSLPTDSFRRTGSLSKGSLPTDSSRHTGTLPKGSLPTHSSRHTGSLPKGLLPTDLSRNKSSSPTNSPRSINTSLLPTHLPQPTGSSIPTGSPQSTGLQDRLHL